MPFKTPDRTPGPSDEEELLLEDRTSDGNPTVDGGVRFVSDDFVGKTAAGVRSLTKVTTSSDDTTPDFLEGKIVAGVGIDVAVLNPGAAETIEISAGVDYQQAYFVGKHGSDSNDGRSPATAFETIGKGMSEALAQTPSASNRFTVVVVDAGIYAENVLQGNFVNLNAPNATIQSVGSGTALSIGQGTRTSIYQVIADTGANAVVRRNSILTSYADIERIVLGGAAIGVLHNGAFIDSVIQLRAGSIFVDTGQGIAVNNIGHMHFNVEDIYLEGNNAIGISRIAAGDTIGRVTHILEVGSPSGTKAFSITNGRVSARVDTIDTDTAWDVGASGQLDLYLSEVNGAEVEAGGSTVNITRVGKPVITDADPQNVGAAASAGSSEEVSRADHVHDHGAQTVDTHHALAVAGVSAGFISG